jgi:transcriptional regulator with XRE-family HTH domain
MKEAQAYRRRFKALGWSQNEAARQIKRSHGLFSRWLRGEFSSAPIRRALDARLAEVE